ncbi:hypothetical protein [Paenibacillus sp. N3.4]|uniref:hypothetical protein n=1 Tax=Paenibacillus sp. N3.4 TaxID=2603222 RepID=UPI0021C4A667|nr:hypothetical protein [Paenibacillus sp. N3.4]
MSRTNKGILNGFARLSTYLFLGSISLLTLFPFWYEIVASFSSSRAINSGEVFFWPVEFNVVPINVCLTTASY